MILPSKIKVRMKRQNIFRQSLISIVGLFLCVSHTTQGQSAIPEGSIRSFQENGHRIEQLLGDKLFDFDVDQIYKDKDGLLWVINTEQIKRFDGNTIEILEPDNDTKVHHAGDQFYRMLRDSKGNFWFTSRYSGVVHYDNQNHVFQRFTSLEKDGDDGAIYDPVEDQYGNIWAGYDSGLLHIKNRDSIQLNKIEPKSLGNILRSKIDHLIEEDRLIEGITKVGSSANLKKEFLLSEDTEVLVLGQGALNYDGYFPAADLLDDYGWIENAKGEKVWEMNGSESYNAGGFIENRLNVEVLTLKRGNYSIHYRTNEIHDFDQFQVDFRDCSPSIKEWWGLQVFQIGDKDKSDIYELIQSYQRNDGLSSFFNQVYKDSDGQIWLYGDSFGKLLLKDQDSYEIEKVPVWENEQYSDKHNYIVALCEKDKENFWLSVAHVDSIGDTETRIGIYNKKSSRFTPIKTGIPKDLKPHYMRDEVPVTLFDAIIQDHNQNLWIGGSWNWGLYKLSPPFIELEDKEKPHMSSFQLFPDGQVKEIRKFELDDFNNLWFGTWHQGAFKIDLNPLPFDILDLSQYDELEDKRMFSFLEDQKGDYWINVTGFKVMHVKSDRETVTFYDKEFKGIKVEERLRVFMELPNGNLLFRADQRLIEYDVVADRAIERIIPNLNLPIMYDDGFILNDSIVFIPGYLININQWKIQEDLSDYVSAGEYYTFLGEKGTSNDFWVIRQWGETAHLQWTEKGIDTLQIINSNVVPKQGGFFVDDDSGIWTTSKFALTKTEAGNTASKIFTSKDGLDLNNTNTVIQRDNELWIFARDEVLRLNLLDNSISRPGQLADLNIHNGVEIKEGNMALFGSQKIFFVDLDKINVDTIPPKMIIESISFVDEDITRTSRTDLSSTFGFGYDQNDITLSYNAVQYNNPAGVNFSYQLENHQTNWQDVGQERIARFSNLPSGDYTFKVKASNAEGYWSAPETLQFTIRPPWWHTWWAYAIYTLIGLALVRWFVQSQRQKVIEKEKQLEKEKQHSIELKNVNAELTSLNTANQRFVPQDFLQILGKDNIQQLRLGDQTQVNMTILFADIRSYTQLSETMSPEDNFKFINGFLGRMGPLIKDHGGFIDKFMGDGLMALFIKDHAAAVKASIKMQQALHEYNQSRKAKGRKTIRTGIGINTGVLMLGIIGDEHRYDSTVIADAVNTASRMEGLTKIFGADIIISENTLNELGDYANEMAYRYIGMIRVKGKQKAIRIYDVYEGDEVSIRQLKAKTQAQFDEAMQLYTKRDFGKAADLLKETLEIYEDDRSAQYYLDKCVTYIIDDVPEGWEAVEEMVMK